MIGASIIRSVTKSSAEAEAKKQARDSRDQQILRRLGERIRNLRNLRDLTQERLAERAGLTSKFLGEVERVETNPSATSLVRIAEGLSVDLGELFEPGAEAVPVDVEGLKRLKDVYSELGRQLTELTRVERQARREREAPQAQPVRVRASKKA